MLQGLIINFIGLANMFKYKLIVGKENFENMYSENESKKVKKQSLLALIFIGSIFLWVFIGTGKALGHGNFRVLISTLIAFVVNNGLTVLIALCDKKAYLNSKDSEPESPDNSSEQ